MSPAEVILQSRERVIARRDAVPSFAETLERINEADRLNTPRVVTVHLTVDVAGFIRALAIGNRQVLTAERFIRRHNRRVAIRRSHVEGVSYGNPQAIHNGRKPTARRRSR